MTKDDKLFKEWIEKQIKFYKPYLGINLSKISVEKDSKIQYLCINCNYPYLDGIIYFSDEALKDWKNGKTTRNMVLHELCHMILAPIQEKAQSRYLTEETLKDEIERLTDTIANIIRNIID